MTTSPGGLYFVQHLAGPHDFEFSEDLAVVTSAGLH